MCHITNTLAETSVYLKEPLSYSTFKADICLELSHWVYVSKVSVSQFQSICTLKFCGDILKFCGDILKFCGDILKFCGDIFVSEVKLVNFCDIPH